MSFSFSFSVGTNGELVQTEQEAAVLKSSVDYGNLKPGTKFSVSGHQPTSRDDWGGSLGIQCEGIGSANMGSVFLKAEPEPAPEVAAAPTE